MIIIFSIYKQFKKIILQNRSKQLKREIILPLYTTFEYLFCTIRTNLYSTVCVCTDTIKNVRSVMYSTFSHTLIRSPLLLHSFDFLINNLTHTLNNLLLLLFDYYV